MSAKVRTLPGPRRLQAAPPGEHEEEQVGTAAVVVDNPHPRGELSLDPVDVPGQGRGRTGSDGAGSVAVGREPLRVEPPHVRRLHGAREV